MSILFRKRPNAPQHERFEDDDLPVLRPAGPDPEDVAQEDYPVLGTQHPDTPAAAVPLQTPGATYHNPVSRPSSTEPPAYEYAAKSSSLKATVDEIIDEELEFARQRISTRIDRELSKHGL
ncbi:hypothetical protein [Brackiella oedipodis]|uniref:hypothetical protein n=1 Tax=Brackiella oedipodis TaxID=124225 RepID=UPI00048B20D5|nr:hypothetical protein [Brackiella oedipodis]